MGCGGRRGGGGGGAGNRKHVGNAVVSMASRTSGSDDR